MELVIYTCVVMYQCLYVTQGIVYELLHFSIYLIMLMLYFVDLKKTANKQMTSNSAVSPKHQACTEQETIATHDEEQQHVEPKVSQADVESITPYAIMVGIPNVSDTTHEANDQYQALSMDTLDPERNYEHTYT